MPPTLHRLLNRLGRRIRALRELAGLSQREVAERAAISLKFYSRVERGAQDCSLETLGAIASAFEVDPGDLLRPLEDDDEPARIPELDRIVVLLEGYDSLQRQSFLQMLQTFTPYGRPERPRRRRRGTR